MGSWVQHGGMHRSQMMMGVIVRVAISSLSLWSMSRGFGSGMSLVMVDSMSLTRIGRL